MGLIGLIGLLGLIGLIGIDKILMVNKLRQTDILGTR